MSVTETDRGDVTLPEGYIATYSGRTINPMEPELDAIVIEDIAHALSNQCRFTGHVATFYSVAEHSVRCALELLEKDFYSENADEWNSARELKLMKWALLHDASEAYLSDIARPVKNALGLGEVYKRAEAGLMVSICQKFDLPWPMPEEIKRVDDTLLRTEQRDLMPLGRIPGDEYAANPITETWTPTEARDQFLKLADELIY